MSIHGAPSPTTSPRAAGPGAVAGAPSPSDRPAGRTVAISVRGLTKTYRAGIRGCSARVDAIRDVDLDIHAGSVLGVLGAAGAGKSTLLLCMAGLLRPDAGRIEWFGRPGDEAGRPPGIAYVPERSVHYTFMTLRESVEYHSLIRNGAARADPAAVDRALARVGLRELADMPIAELPWGAGPQLSMAHAIADDPRVLLLDETVTRLHPSARRSMVRTLRDLSAGGTAVVIASAAIDALEGLAPRVAIVSDGRVSPPVDADVLERPSMLELTVATPAMVRRLFGARVAEDEWEREVVRVPLDGTTAEAVLARCRACGIRVERSRVVPAAASD